ASACADTLAASVGSSSVRPDSPGASQPPVSTTVNERPAQSASNSRRSRVTPGFCSTIASRRPTIRFTSVDFPTFGRPTIATTGIAGGAGIAGDVMERGPGGGSGERTDERGAVGGDDLDW